MKFNSTNEPYIIAEIGANHNGNLDLAYKLIDEAKRVGCDSVKFQSWDRDLFANEVYDRNAFLKDGRELEGNLEMLVEKFSLSFEDLKKLSEYSFDVGIDFASSVFTIKQVEQIKTLNPAFIKIASMDLNFDLLIKEVGHTGLHTVLSTGLSDFKEIKHAVETFEKTNNNNLFILHCKSVYPPSDDKIDLNNIDLFKKEFRYPVGFSDHSVGIDIPLAAFSKGIAVYEKHFTLDKTMDGWDHATSADPSEMLEIVNSAKRISKALGSKKRIVYSEELEMRKAFRRSIVAKNVIPAGTKISFEMLDFKRPGTGMNPNSYKDILGSVALEDIIEDEIISIKKIKKENKC